MSLEPHTDAKNDTAINSSSSVENQTSVKDKLERSIESPNEEIAKAPITIRSELSALWKGMNSSDEASRDFLLRVIQPGLAGLMDGSVSTLAPIFATAFATHRPFTAFLVGMAAATGAGISMAFSEALSDDGALTGPGNPVLRGSITGGMTILRRSLHTLPFLVPDLHLALLIAYIVVAVEL